MKNVKFRLPKKYWVYVSAAAVFAVLLFVNLYITDELTGEKEFGKYTKADWFYFAAFLLTEIILGLIMSIFAIKGGRLMAENSNKIAAFYDRLKYVGIKPGDYDYVWFDFSGAERAMIMKNGNSYMLYVEELDEHDTWQAVNTVSVYDSLEALKKALFYEFDFFCEENSELNNGDEVFKENS